MDNLNDIINNLSEDDINMLKSVASSILGEEAQKNTPPQQNGNAGSKNTAADHQARNHTNKNVNQAADVTNALALANGLDNIDFDMIMKAKNIFEKMNSTKSKNADLIMALKPHLNPKTQNKADQALRILKLFEVLPLLRELF